MHCTDVSWLGPRRARFSRVPRLSWHPFAAPPVAELRFALPVERAAWHGVRDCTERAPAAVHRISAMGESIGLGVDHQSEDCLHVTVWTPDVSAPESQQADGSRSAKRPVLLWIHGGGFQSGGASHPFADGAALAFAKDVVIVSLQYRLGALGFLAIPGTPANRGFEDQLLALRWVVREIAAFGGDPSKITLFGASAGAVSVLQLLTEPRAVGLFSRAIVQSGHAECFSSPVQDARVLRELARELSLGALAPTELRAALESVAIEDLVAAQRRTCDTLDREFSGIVFRPLLQAGDTTQTCLARLRRGSGSRVPLLIGTNADEMRVEALSEFDFGVIEESELLSRVVGFGQYAMCGPKRPG